MLRLLTAIDFAANKHRQQRRKDPEGTPYINHPIGVARILYEEGGVDDTAALMAAVLHDTVEDTDTTFDEAFGDEVSRIVAECTDDKTLPKADRKRLQIENAPHKSDKAKLVKLADKIYNLRDLQRTTPKGWTPERVAEYFVWAKRVTDGCRGVNARLESILDRIYAESIKA
nr:Guanosine-3',5'-bis(diphosphate) 3'-pyrophosphohydrolase MESH1 [Polyrhizophydium stewartii]